MGTTLSFLYFHKRRYFIGHIGDSRIYLIRKGKLIQLTKDDTLVQKKVDEGLITPEEAKNSPESHILTKALGVGDEPTFQILSGKLKKGDFFLLTTDGLTGELADKEIQDIISISINLEDAVQSLIKSVLQRDAKDNVTVVAVQFGRKWPVILPPTGKTPPRLEKISESSKFSFKKFLHKLKFTGK
jgi:protein phosphatase